MSDIETGLHLNPELFTYYRVKSMEFLAAC